MDETKPTAETGSEDNSDSSQRQQQLVDMGSATIKTERGTIHTLTIVGQVEGHQLLPPTAKTTKYEHVMPLLAALEESDEVDGLLVLLNTVGGDIEAGLGIAELISSMSKPTVSLVLGGGHSIGVPLAVSAKRSFIAPSAAMTAVKQSLGRHRIGYRAAALLARVVVDVRVGCRADQAERAGHRRPPDVQLFRTDPGADHPVCHQKQRCQARYLYENDAPDRRAGR